MRRSGLSRLFSLKTATPAADQWAQVDSRSAEAGCDVIDRRGGLVGQNRRYADGVARREEGRYDRLQMREARPRSLTDQQLELARHPLTRFPQPLRVLAWVDYGDHAVRVRGAAVAATPNAVAVRWPVVDVEGELVIREDRAWLWRGAVDFFEDSIAPDETAAVNVSRRRA